MARDPRRDRRRSPLSVRPYPRESSDPFELKRNHQVLAYGYDLAGTDLELRLYAPNRPKDDGVTLSLDLSTPTQRTPVLSHPAGPAVFSFFKVPYEARTPP